MRDTTVFVFVTSSLANVLEEERESTWLMREYSEQDIYRFGDRRFRHQRRLEVEDTLGILHYKRTTVAGITLDRHGTIQRIWVRSVQGKSRGSIAIPRAVPLDRKVLIHGR